MLLQDVCKMSKVVLIVIANLKVDKANDDGLLRDIDDPDTSCKITNVDISLN